MNWKKILLQVLLFIFVFSGTALAFNYISYRGYQDSPVETANPELPVVYLKYGDYMADRMLGYQQAMDTAMMREEVVPVGEDKTVHILLQSEDAEAYAGSLSYELRTLDGTTLIENGDLQGGTEDGGYTEFTVSFRMNMTPGQEYVLVVRINREDGNLRYYSRVVQLDRDFLNDFLAYAFSIHNATFADKSGEDDQNEEGGGLIAELFGENQAQEDKNDLSDVNLESPYDLVTWGKLAPVIVSEVVPMIQEVDSDSAVIGFRYVIQSGVKGEVSEYMVSEYYGLRYDNGENRVVLQDFERTMEEVFQYDHINIENNSINLGIHDESVTYRSSEDGRKVVFVSAGELWYYDYKASAISKVYGIRTDGYQDVREIQNKNGLTVLSVSDDGIVDFIVYGRIARGKHEGENGIILYEYNAEKSELTELGCISCNLPYGILDHQAGRFAYLDREQGNFYVLINDSVLKLDVNTGETSYIVENMPAENIYVSEDGSVLAYPNDSHTENVTEIAVWNCETGETTREQAKTGCRLSIVGFLGNDLVFGEAETGRITRDISGRTEFLFCNIYIADRNGMIKKDYHKDQILISGIRAEEDSIYLSRYRETEDGTLVESANDYMSYTREDAGGGLSVQKLYDENTYKETHLTFPAGVMLQSTPKEVLTKETQKEDLASVSEEGKTNQEFCYLFEKRGLSGIYFSAGEAVKNAQGAHGIVLDGLGNVIYKDRETAPYNTVAGTFSYQQAATEESSIIGLQEESFHACCYMCLLAAGCSAEYQEVRQTDTWEEAFTNDQRVMGLNLSGIDLDTALGYLSDGNPFAVRIDDGRFVLVVSYNATHIRYYDPIRGEEVRVGRKSFEKDMEKNGNAVFSYIKY